MERLGYTVPLAAEVASISRAQLYKEIAAGRLRMAKVGRRSIITSEALRDWLRDCEQNTAADAVGAR